MNLSFLDHLVRMTAEEIIAGGTVNASDPDAIELHVTDTGEIVLLLPSGTVEDGYRCATIDFPRPVDPATREPGLRRLLGAD